MCTQITFFCFCFDIVYTTCAELVFPCNSMSNLLSYCGLIDAKMRASDKDLPVKELTYFA